MKCICNDCEKVFDAEEMETIFESRGEYWGFPAYEEIGLCPFCHSDDIGEYEGDDEDDDED